MEIWELEARERIRDTIARYTWAGDSLELDELAGAFCEDGELEVRGQEAARGREAIVALISGASQRRQAPSDPAAGPGQPRRIVRHNVANVRFLELQPERALVAAYFTVFTEIGLDHYGRYRDTFVPVGDEWLIRHRFVSTDWRAEHSTMARPASPGAGQPRS
jgi:hypothetical protein